MAKIICKKCGKIFSDVSAFCPKCGAPAEISSRPESIGGRQMAAAGRSARANGTGTIDGKKFRSGDLLNEGSPRSSGKGMSHSHSSFDDICSGDDSSPLGAVKKLAEKQSGGAKTPSASINFRRHHTSDAGRSSGTGSGAGSTGRSMDGVSGSPYTSGNSGARRSSNGRYQVQSQPGKIIVVIIAVIIGLNILSVIVTSCASLITRVPDYTFDDTNDTYTVTESDDEFMQKISDQLYYRSTLNDNDLKNLPDDEYVKFFQNLINDELSELTPYQSTDYSSIEYYIDNYIEGLQLQLNALDYYTTDKSEFNYYWNSGYNDRVYSIVNLYDYYGMQLDEDLYNVYKADYDSIYSSDSDTGSDDEGDAPTPADDADTAAVVTLPLYGGRPVYDDGNTI